MAKRLEDDAAFRMLAAGNFPKHRALCEVQKRHLGDFRAAFDEVVVLARASGLAGLGRCRWAAPRSGRTEQAQGDVPRYSKRSACGLLRIPVCAGAATASEV